MSQQNLQPDNDYKLVALGRTLQTLREEENADVLVETTVDYLRSEFQYPLIWIGLYDRLEHRLLGKGGIAPMEDTKFLKQWFHLKSGDLLEQVVIQQRPVGVPDLRQEVRAGEWRRVAQEFGIQGTLVFPLRYKDRCYGVALLGSSQWGVSPRPAEKALLSMLLGGLAATLYQIEVNWQRLATKRPDQPLFQVIDELAQVPTLAQRLDAVVKMTQQFVSSTRTSLYWYCPERRYFWHRLGNQQLVRRLGDSRSSVAGLTVAEVSDFYQTLAAGELVTIGAGRSPLSSKSTERLIARLRTRSLLAAPIQAKGELLGFLAVEDYDARIWEEVEKNFVRAAAQLLGLVADDEEMETTLQLASQDTHFPAEIAQAIARSSDTTTALRECAKLLCKRLDAEYFLVLQKDDNSQFTLVFQQQPLTSRPLTTPLPPLSPNNLNSLFINKTNTISIEDLNEDIQLFQWRESLLQLGVRSVLLVPLGREAQLSPLESLLKSEISQTENNDQQWQTSGLFLVVIGHKSPRTWSRVAQDLMKVVAQQMNLLLSVGQLQDIANLSCQRHQTMETGLSILREASLDLLLFDRTWIDYLASVLECPLTALIAWPPNSERATVATAVVTDSRFALPPDLAISVASDALIQATLATNSFLCRSVAELPAATRKWLSGSGIGQLLAIAVQSDGVPATGIVLLADREERQWPGHLLEPLSTLTQQFSHLRNYRYRLSRLTQEEEKLQTLNWYKHRCLDILHQSITQNVSGLQELDPKIPQQISEITDNRPLQQTRRHQLLHQLEQTLVVLTSVLEEEQWQLKMNRTQVPLTNLLKRSLQYVEPIYKQRQLVIRVQNAKNLTIYGDRLKLECILFEVLVTSCRHAPPGSRINLWCCPIAPESSATPRNNSSLQLLELLVTESGLVDDNLNAFTYSPSDSPPNQNLKICQKALRSWGGNLQFYQLEGNSAAAPEERRYSMRLLLPLAN
ncbi:MAG TPA: GAF domain-containing protein [Cyanobacteria bacterium UBA8553]|nr:GAF domain-containing protein [Cyanobacteria bacterium UBA8553]